MRYGCGGSKRRGGSVGEGGAEGLSDRGGASTSRRRRRTILIAAVLVVCVVSVFGPTALAVPPSPHLLDLAEKDPALASRLESLQRDMRSKGIDAPATKDSAPVTRPDGLAVSPTGAITTGQLKTLAILVDFSDQTGVVSASFFDSLLFTDVYGPSSLRGYYREVSYGTLTSPACSTWSP